MATTKDDAIIKAVSKFAELAISELFTGRENKAVRSDLRNLAKDFKPAYWGVGIAPDAAAIQAEGVKHMPSAARIMMLTYDKAEHMVTFKCTECKKEHRASPDLATADQWLVCDGEEFFLHVALGKFSDIVPAIAPEASELPPLPKKQYEFTRPDPGWFTAGQMQDYARAAIAMHQTRSPYVLGVKPSNWDEQIAMHRAAAEPVPTSETPSDAEIIAACHSVGVDTYPSVYGFEALQVKTSVPCLRNIFNALRRATKPAASEAVGVPLCICGQPLCKVTQSANSMLNSEQFDAAKLGDWFCNTCPADATVGGKYRYFLNSDLATPAAPTDAKPREQALAEFTAFVMRHYPPDSVITDPAWHAPWLFRAAESALKSSPQAPKTEGGE